MNAGQSRGRRQKQKIAQVALKLFARKGFDAVSVREIATKAQVNVSMISYYFGSKLELYQYLVESYFIKMQELSSELHRSSPLAEFSTYKTLLIDMTMKWLAFRKRYFDYHNLLYQEMIKGQKWSEEIRLKYQEELTQPFLSLLRLGQDRGWIQFAGDPAIILLGFAGMLDKIHIFSQGTGALSLRSNMILEAEGSSVESLVQYVFHLRSEDEFSRA